MEGAREDSWSTLYRAPQMHAISGAWLEAFSKRDAQAILIALPWTVMLGSLTFFVVLHALEAFFSEPYIVGVFEEVLSGVHYLLALGCGLYVPVALLIERPSSCCRTGPKRSKEGWMAVGAVAACALIALGYARSMHSLPDQISIIYGSVAFRAASTGEFLLQIAWLWAAAGLRCEPGQRIPRWRGWSYFLLTCLWSFTWWGGADGRQPEAMDHVIVTLGYSARLILFGYCVTRVFRKCSRHCQCCCFCASCRDEWTCLENLPCTPGQERLRYLLYYLLTRPPFLLVMNLPLGYPLSGLGLATWALLLRCGLVLLIAMSLQPAPAPVEEHPIERASKEQFDILLALHLCDFSWEAYSGPPEPAVLVLSGCSFQDLNGEYMQAGRDDSNQPIYRRDLPVHTERQAILRMADGNWEVVTRSSGGEERRCLYTEDAEKPAEAETWTEVLDEEVPNASVKITVGAHEAKRHHSVSGGCPQLDVQWLLAEQMGPLTSEVEGPDRGAKEVSIVVAFRGTASVKNVVTDVRMSLQPLAEESKTGPFGICQGPVACFDLEPQVLAKLRAQEPLNPFSPVSRNGAAEPLRRASTESIGEENFGLPGCCRLLAACCSKLFFPFLPSDDDDEELSQEVLSDLRVHKGFQEAYGAIRSDVLTILEARLEHWKKEGVIAKVYATGHSMGGAIANLFALDLNAAPDVERFCFAKPLMVYTFGAPRAGNAAFRSTYNALVPQTFRVVASRDVVPTLPPSIAYRQIGREVWVDDAGELTYVMSWAMRHILPARDSVWYHPTLAYYKLLNRALLRKTSWPFRSRFRGELPVREALNGKPLGT